MTHSHSYSVLSLPFYDTRQQQYLKILCVNAPPAGPLAARVKTVRPPPLSSNSSRNSSSNSNSCNSRSNSCNSRSCIHALTYEDATFMTPDDLPELFAFLANNGYTVEVGLTKLVANTSRHAYTNANANANSLVCIISYAAAAS